MFLPSPYSGYDVTPFFFESEREFIFGVAVGLLVLRSRPLDFNTCSPSPLLHHQLSQDL